ncbi:thiamine-monophosphate kinase [Qipengyuania flava]|uniref:Thiamine-monophosphate kinase n=1 Tax=Qipengyuania flava TaxID=192812 RepID=A0A3T1CHB4_9SPHN|nr:thiamine-monophosphate kinase [Qipengyuania flava]
MQALAKDPAARGLKDDAAVLPLGDDTLVITLDTLVQGVHVREDEDPADIAWKLIAVNLSDLAAKGAAPTGVLISHMLGEADDRFLGGLRAALETFEVPLLGGDTVRAEGRRVWGCTAIGRATHTPVPDRRGARPGDAIYVTGTLGRAMLGLHDRGSGSADDLAYRRPRPLLAEGRALAPLVTAMMDVSDGLLLDASRMAHASDTRFEIDSARVPAADRARADECMRWGDDYQLLFTVPDGVEIPVEAARIGTVREGPAGLWLDGRSAGEDKDLGYRH